MLNGLMGRLYGLDGCPHCEAAAAFFMGAGVPVQLCSIKDDPVAEEGLKKVLGTEEGAKVSVPVLVAFPTKEGERPEVVVGAKYSEYARLVNAFRTSGSDSGSGVPPGGERAPIAVEEAIAEASASEAGAGVPEVSSGMGSGSSSAASALPN